MPHMPIPLELVDHIVQDLADASHSLKDVKKCALTCRSFVPICRKHLFATIHLRLSPKYIARTETFRFLLRRSPGIADYVRHLQLDIENHGSCAWYDRADLQLFSRLRTYELVYCSPDIVSRTRDYRYLDCHPAKIPIPREILFHPIPTLTTLKLHHFINFPFHELLLHYPNIRELELSNLKVSEQTGIFFNLNLARALPTSLKPIKLESFHSDFGDDDHVLAVQKMLELRQPDGQPIIDISGLRHLNISCDDDSNLICSKTAFVMLLQTNQLTTLTLDTGETAQYLTGIGQLLLASSMTLKDITILSQAAEYFDDDPLHGLCPELEILGKQPNVLESLSYLLHILPGDRCSTGDEWRALDRVIDTFAWPQLKKVAIEILAGRPDVSYELMEASDYEEEEMEPRVAKFRRRLYALRKRRFPVLSRRLKKDFKVTILWD